MKTLASVVGLILLSVTLLIVLDSGAEVKSPRKEESSFSAAHCHGSIAKTEWTLADGNSPTPACVVGNDVRKGVLNFDADEVQGAIVPFTLPGQFRGKLNVTIMWQAASTIGSVGWCENSLLRLISSVRVALLSGELPITAPQIRRRNRPSTSILRSSST